MLQMYKHEHERSEKKYVEQQYKIQLNAVWTFLHALSLVLHFFPLYIVDHTS